MKTNVLKAKRPEGGFTLIELSLVLVLLGLITAGIMLGQSLVKNAQRQEVIKSSRAFATAAQSFRDTYGGLPGDLNNATQHWGAAAGGTGLGPDDTCVALDSNSPSSGLPTCNGDGDGIVHGTANYERFRFWQHLTNAGLLPGHFVGVVGPASANDHVPGWNAPPSRYPGGVWTTTGDSICRVSEADSYDGCYGNILEMHAADDSARQIMTPLDAFSIDQKIDDGKPSVGRVVVYKSTLNPGCTTSDVDATAQYATTSTAIACTPIFINVF